jgi:hypothetical protein
LGSGSLVSVISTSETETGFFAEINLPADGNKGCRVW